MTYEEALLSLNDEEAEYAASLRPEVFWGWYRDRQVSEV